jgi:hypothetical protein
MRDVIYGAIVAIPCIVLYELISGRLLGYLFIGGTRRSDNPRRYWARIVWKILLLIFGIWFTTTPYFAQLQK